MSWPRLRATASGLRNAPNAALLAQRLPCHASSRQASTRRLDSSLANMFKFQLRSLTGLAKPITYVSQAEIFDGTKPRIPRKKKTPSYKKNKQEHPQPTEIISADDNKHNLCLSFEKPHETVAISKLWLRDACTCQSCVSPSSGQKTFATTDVPLSPEVAKSNVTSNGHLEVTWANDFRDGQNHDSLYTAEFLNKYVLRPQPPPQNLPRSLWNKSQLETVLSPITYAEWMSGGEDFVRAFFDLIRYGIIFLRDVPLEETSVEEIAKQIGHLQSTFYGLTWDVISKPEAENVAYTNVFLGLHQDLMYWNDVPKIQILHCLENSCEGGDSIFSDGLRTALEIQATNRQYFTILRKVRVPYHYDIAPHKYRRDRPVIATGSGNQKRNARHAIRDVYWSPPFQAPFFALKEVPGLFVPGKEEQKVWHAAAKVFKDGIEAPENVFQYKMKPGDCVLFDNRRVFHGRREFDTSSGKRWLKGGYISSEVLHSKASSLKEAGLMPVESPSQERFKLETV